MKVLIVYHANCRDGQAAAYAAVTGLERMHGEGSVKAIPFTYDQNPAEVIQEGLDASFLVIVDFSFKRGPLTELAQHFESVLVLDHHKTAQAELENWTECPKNVTVFFDMSRSGAMMSYDYFFGASTALVPRSLYEYVQDRDLWTWKLHGSKEVSAWLSTFGDDLAAFHTACQFVTANSIGACIAAGSAVIGYQNQVVAKHLKNIAIVDWRGHKVALVNATTMISEICNDALTLHPQADFAMAYQDIVNEDKRVFSLRSRKGGVDVSAIAKTFGGGGHAAAAGFTRAMPFVGVND